jgi:murein DD-endopeptidase MepM/ murein hydrolase activator NlpD
MRFLYDPIKGLSSGSNPKVRLSHDFGNDPIASVDTWYGSTLVRKGQHVYQVLAGQDGHNGWDIAAPLGEPIYAPCNGWLVEQTAKETGYGLRVTMRAEAGGMHFMLVFGHMQRLELNQTFGYDWNNKTRPVRAGQAIGYVNSTGASTGNHLHFSVYPMKINGEKAIINGFGGAVDPTGYMLEQDPPKGDSMRIVNDNGTVFLVGKKAKIGLADKPFLDALLAIDDVETGSTAGIPQVRVIESTQPGFVVKDH